MKSRGAARIGVAVASIALVASACSSSKSTSSSPGGGSSGGTTPKGTPIIVGNIGSYSGPHGSTPLPGRAGIQAWAASVNASGGINGHPIKLIVKDDTSNPTTALSQVKELISDHVVAIVSDQSNEDTQWASAVQAANVPVLGGFGVNVPLATNPDFFPTGANVFSLTYATQVEAQKLGPKFGVLYCAETPSCQNLAVLSKAISQKLGENLAIAQSVSASAPDYTALCQSIKNSGVQSYTIGAGTSVVTRVVKACWDQGVRATQQVVGGLDPTWLSEPSFNNSVSVNDTFPYFDKSTPQTQAFQDAMSKYGGGITGSNAAESWVAGKLFEAAVAKIPSAAEITSASLKTGLYALKDETLGGLSIPLNYSQGKPTMLNCWYVAGISDGKLTEPQGLKTDCVSDAVIGGILAQTAPKK